MRIFLFFISLFLPASAIACAFPAELNYSDVGKADTVIIGEVLGYRMIQKTSGLEGSLSIGPPYAFRSVPDMESLLEPSEFLILEVAVDEVLRGSGWTQIYVVVSSGELGQLSGGPLLIALNKVALPQSGVFAIDGQPRDQLEEHLFAIFSPLCTRAFLFHADGEEAAEIRKLLTE